jgi:transcriptional regulator with XRE-family HTH domain
MGTNELVKTELRNALFRLRDSRGWSMAAMADILRGKGITAYPTTIAKIEAGDRAVQVDELVAFAEIFGVSVDTLLGHTTSGTGTKFMYVDRLADQARRAYWSIQTSEAALRDALTAVDGYTLNEAENTLRVGVTNACKALADAAKAIKDTDDAVDWIYDQEDLVPVEDRIQSKGEES